MKNRIVIRITAIVMTAFMFVLCGFTTVDQTFAADDTTVTTESGTELETEDLIVTTEAAIDIPTPTAISLEDAYKQMEISDTWALLELFNLSDEGVARGYSESISSLKEEIEANNTSFSVSYNSSDYKQTNARKAYAQSMLLANSEARENALNLEVFKKYFSLKNAAANVKIAESNLQVKEDSLSIAEKKYQLGTASKLDLLTAEIDYADAQNNLIAVENSFASTQMTFNVYMSYDLMQEVVLIDELEEMTLPAVTLDEAIELAIANRIDIKAAEYALEMAQYGFNTYSAYPTNSSKYLSAKVTLTRAQINNTKAPLEVEQDVREKYASMMENYNAVQLDVQSIAKAQESVIIAQKRYEVGLITLSELQQVETSLYSSQISQATNLLNYNSSVELFIYSYGVGTVAASI